MGLIFLLALGVRIVLAWLTYVPRYVYSGEAEWIGKSLALHRQFAGAYAIPTGPTAHCGPFYTSLISLVFVIFGTGHAAELVRIGLLILVNSVGCALLPLVATSLELPLWCGAGAGFAAALFPMHRTAEIFHAWDEPYAALALMAILVMQVRWTPFHDRSPRHAIVYGLLWGLLLHMAPAFLPVFAVMIGVAPLWQRRAIRQEAARYLLVVAMTGLSLVPWTLRNRMQLGGWILIRSNFGIELDMSNNDRSGPSTDDNHKAGLYRDTHPSINVAEATRVRDLGEIAYNRQRVTHAMEWIRAHPGRFAGLTLARIRIFWFGWWGNPETAWLFALATILAVAGGWFLWRDGHRYILSLFAVVWIAYPLTYCVIQQVPRYRIPIWWTVVLTAAYGAGSLWRRRRRT